MNNLENSNLELPFGWILSTKAEAETRLSELQKELSIDHILYGKFLSVIAHREDFDDILCKDNTEEYYYVVHLTWAGKRENNSNYPKIIFGGNFADFTSHVSNLL